MLEHVSVAHLIFPRDHQMEIIWSNWKRSTMNLSIIHRHVIRNELSKEIMSGEEETKKKKCE